MAETEDATTQAEWDVMNPASKENLLRVLREEADRTFRLAAVRENWQKPTASGHWQVRDIVGHMVDVTEGYLNAFRIAREEGEAPPPHGLLPRAELLDEHAQAFRSESQPAMMQRLRDDLDQMMTVFEGLSDED